MNLTYRLRAAPSAHPHTGVRRGGFTLIELLVVIGIILVLTGLTLAVYTGTMGGDRIRSGARDIQAAMLGARDRAAKEKAVRGLRLIPDPNNNNFVIGFQYVRPIRQSYPSGSIQLERPDADSNSVADNANITVVRAMGSGIDWGDWKAKGLFQYPARIRIKADVSEPWYLVDTTAYTTGTPYITLTQPYPAPSGSNAFPAVVAVPSTNTDYSKCEIEFGTQFLENTQAFNLTSGTVIQISRSQGIPADWNTNRNAMDVMFSPGGAVTGPLVANGPIYLYLANRQDAEQNLDPVVSKGEKLVLAIFPQTGNVGTYTVDLTDSDNNGAADDPFRRAKLGATAGK